MDHFLALEAVLTRTTMSRSALYRAIDTQGFPRAIKLAARTKAWSEIEVNNWMARVRETAPREGDLR